MDKLLTEINKFKKLMGLLETEGADPKNPDSHPDLDDWGPDSWWKFADWKTWFNSSVKKYGWDKAKQNFSRFWMAVEEGTNVGTKNDIDTNWLKQAGLWNDKTGKVYTRDEMIKLTSQPQKKSPNLGNNESIVYNFLRKNGFSKAGTAAIMGNIMQETSFNDKIIKNAHDDVGAPSLGIIQWRGQRFYPTKKVDVEITGKNTPNVKTNCSDKTNPSRLKNLMCKNPNSFTNINTQLNFMIEELSNFPELLKKLKIKTNSEKNVGDLSLEINNKFIKGTTGGRYEHAVNFFNKFKDESIS